jgi:hypothetical protein
MSVEDFKNTIKSQAYRTWFARIEDSILKQSAGDLRSSQEVAGKTSFYITEQTIRDIAEKLSQGSVSDQQVAQIKAKIKSYFNGKRVKEISQPYIEGKGLYFPRVSFDTIGRILETGFAEVSNPQNKKISDFFQRGHVYGIATKTLEQSIDKLVSNKTIEPKAKQLLLGVLNDMYARLEKEDLATSNLGETTASLYAKYKKRKYSYLVEMQLKVDNQKAGREAAPLINAIRRYFDPDKIPASEKSGIKFRQQDSFFKALIESRGSPSLLDMIQTSISMAFEGKPQKNNESYATSMVLANQKSIKVNNKQVSDKIKKDKQALNKLRKEIEAIPVRQPQLGIQNENLISLQLLINAQLTQRIKENMGTGNRKDILNLRTGRFAESVKVERLSESRAGMITAFYTYMRNPYATFSEGGRQETPRSRDPKLLISKSIREIAQSKVQNRLRAVLV